MIRCFIAAVTVLALAGAVPSAAADKVFSLGQYGGVVIDVPEGWTGTLQGKDDPGGPAIRLTPPASKPIGVLLTPIPVPYRVAGISAELRKGMDAVVGGLKKVAAEPEVAVRELPCRGGRLLVASITDKTVTKPSLEDFKYADQGYAAVGSLWVSFTVLSNYPPGPERTTALEAVRSLKYVPPGPPWRRPGGIAAFSMAGKPWRLALDLPGWTIGATSPLNSGGTRLEARREGGWLLTAFLEPSKPGMTAVQHREEAWRTIPPAERVDVRRSERDSMALLRHRVPTANGQRLDMENVNAYLVRGDVWVDVHLSKTPYRPADEPAIEAILQSIRFEN